MSHSCLEFSGQFEAFDPADPDNQETCWCAGTWNTNLATDRFSGADAALPPAGGGGAKSTWEAL